MKLKLENSKIINNNDVYFMEVINNKIIINNNYFGLIVLDTSFNVLKEITILDSLLIYSCFNNSENIVLYCNENKCFILLNLINYNYKIIFISNSLGQSTFNSYFHWEKDSLLVLSDNGLVLIKLDFHKNSMTIIHKLNAHDSALKFFERAEFLRKHLVHKIYQENEIYEVEGKLYLHDIKTDEERLIINQKIDFHDIEILDNYVLQISENAIIVSYNADKYILKTKSENDYFIRGKIITELDEKNLIVLVANKKDILQTRIERYSIDTSIQG